MPGDGELHFGGRVCIVTGSGRGLGRSHALLLAARGAKVVVNDLGCSRTGDGAGREPAGETVAAIVAAGGEAIVDFSDVSTVAGAETLVDAAVHEYGRVDAIVCNAGITEMAPFADTSLADFERMWRVHVGGTVNVLRAAWSMLARDCGRAVLTTSAAGLFGMVELAPYCAAKAAVAALVRALAQEGRASGIAVNGVAPAAYTRMFWDLIDDEAAHDYGRRYLSEAAVSPVVAWLCHASCPVSGEIFEVGGGRVSRVLVGETRGYTSAALTVEEVRDNLARVMDETGYFVPADANAVGALTAELVSAGDGEPARA